MALSTLPLCYCTNVHSWRSLEEIEAGLAGTTSEVARLAGRRLSAGLWFSDVVSRQLDEEAGAVSSLAARLEECGLTCHTLNAFPHGDFHGKRVKELVYRPDWADRERLEYTLRCARALAELLPAAREGSISTMPLGFASSRDAAGGRRSATNGPDNFLETCCRNLCELARELDNLHSDSGRMIRLAIEPEPFCEIETTAGAIAFFERLRGRAEEEGVGVLVDEHIGLCYDVCHQAVEFEDISASIAALAAARIRINKVQLSSAIELVDPGNNEAGRVALRDYVEPRYLHQTFARDGDRLAKQVDLTREFCEDPPEDFRVAEAWRVHFHVPVNEDRLGPLGTTSRYLREALASIGDLEYAPHLEVETYTWSVLPGQKRTSLEEGLARELMAAQGVVDGLAGGGGG